jgi:hypothetical protein
MMEDEEWLEERKNMQDHLEELKKELDAYWYAWGSIWPNTTSIWWKHT